MSEVYSIFLSAVFSSFVLSTIIVTVITLIYHLTYKCFASYISFDKIARAEHQMPASRKLND